MDCKSCKTKADIPYIAYESAMARNERTVKRLVAVIIVMAVILCATVGGFLWYLSQYDFSGEDVTVDATEDDAAVTPTPSIFVRRYASLTVERIA